MVTIDFGNGEIVQRTLHGNVATYVCNAQGNVLDVLPGIYDAPTFQKRLNDLVKLHQYTVDPDAIYTLTDQLREYHEKRLESISDNRELHYESFERAMITGIERGVKIVLKPSTRIASRAAFAKRQSRKSTENSGDPHHHATPTTPQKLSESEMLARDTALNENVRRVQIHKYLGDRTETISPDQLKHWLYREVLHADLDDPYLGLGSILFDPTLLAKVENGDQTEGEESE